MTPAAAPMVCSIPWRLTSRTRLRSRRRDRVERLPALERVAGHRADAGVGEHDVEAALGLHDPVDDRLYRVGVGDVDDRGARVQPAVGEGLAWTRSARRR